MGIGHEELSTDTNRGEPLSRRKSGALPRRVALTTRLHSLSIVDERMRVRAQLLEVHEQTAVAEKHQEIRLTVTMFERKLTEINLRP